MKSIQWLILCCVNLVGMYVNVLVDNPVCFAVSLTMFIICLCGYVQTEDWIGKIYWYCNCIGLFYSSYLGWRLKLLLLVIRRSYVVVYVIDIVDKSKFIFLFNFKLFSSNLFNLIHIVAICNMFTVSYHILLQHSTSN